MSSETERQIEESMTLGIAAIKRLTAANARLTAELAEHAKLVNSLSADNKRLLDELRSAKDLRDVAEMKLRSVGDEYERLANIIADARAELAEAKGEVERLGKEVRMHEASEATELATARAEVERLKGYISDVWSGHPSPVTEPSEEMIEEAAKAVQHQINCIGHGVHPRGDQWDECSEEWKALRRYIARAVLSTASRLGLQLPAKGVVLTEEELGRWYPSISAAAHRCQGWKVYTRKAEAALNSILAARAGGEVAETNRRLEVRQKSIEFLQAENARLTQAVLHGSPPRHCPAITDEIVEELAKAYHEAYWNHSHDFLFATASDKKDQRAGIRAVLDRAASLGLMRGEASGVTVKADVSLLKAARLLRFGLRQFAETCGIKPSDYCHIEQHQRWPTADEALKIVTVLLKHRTDKEHPSPPASGRLPPDEIELLAADVHTIGNGALSPEQSMQIVRSVLADIKDASPPASGPVVLTGGEETELAMRLSEICGFSRAKFDKPDDAHEWYSAWIGRANEFIAAYHAILASRSTGTEGPCEACSEPKETPAPTP